MGQTTVKLRHPLARINGKGERRYARRRPAVSFRAGGSIRVDDQRRTSQIRARVLDAEEHAEEPVGQLLVATDRSTVEATECGEDKAAGIEFDHCWQVGCLALFIRHAVR